MFVGFIVSLALCILSNCETSKRQREGLKSSLGTKRRRLPSHLLKNRGYFCMCVQLKKSFFAAPRCGSPAEDWGDATGSTEDHQTMWTCGCDRSSRAVLRVLQKTGSCLSFVPFVAMIGAGESIGLNRFIEIRVQLSATEGFRFQASKSVYRV